MTVTRLPLLLLISLLLSCMVQAADTAPKLTVQIGDAAPVTLDAAALELLPHQTVKAKEHDGQEAEWNGIPLYQILQHAGFPLGDSLRGPALAKYVLVTAADGYRAVFSLPELDPRCTDAPVILATDHNASPLPPEQGPWRLVLPKEKRHFRWVRQVVRMEVREVR